MDMDKKINLAIIASFILWLISLVIVGKGEYGLNLVDWWWHTEVLIPAFFGALVLVLFFKEYYPERNDT